MDQFLKTVTIFANPLAYLIALVLMTSILQRTKQDSLKSSILMGALFSITLLISMVNPIDLGAGGIHDMRGLIIGTASALMGPIVGVMTLLTGILMRWSHGGPGMVAGLVAMMCAATGGLGWRLYVRDRDISTSLKTFLLGLMISAHLIALLLLPMDLWNYLFIVMTPMYLVANLIGAAVFYQLLGREKSFLSEAETMKEVANTDNLTGVLNRRGLKKTLPSLEAQHDWRRGQAFLYFDVDNFKRTNDTYGHATGDAVLINIVERIGKNLRGDEVFARIGGDEFVIILPDVTQENAEFVSERCRSAVASEAFVHEGTEMTVSISLGAIWMLEPGELDEMLEAADRALYLAKTRGRNNVVFLSEFQKEQPAEHLSVA